MLIKIGGYNYTNARRTTNPALFLDSLTASDALLRLELFDDCLSLDDVFSQRCGKFDPYSNNYNGDRNYRDIVLPEGLPRDSQLSRAARQRFNVAFEYPRPGRSDGLYNPYNLPRELIPDVSSRDNPY